MVSILLAVIYLAFISLGLPDSLLGSAWPVMYRELEIPISCAGIISMIISGGTMISSLCSDRVTRKMGTGLVTAVSVALTAGALAGFSVSGSFAVLCLCAIPYGLGAGAIDAALNNYVALHYNSRQMSWLHCFWGVGASVSPYIMGYAISAGHGWRNGYRMGSVVQMLLTVVLFLALPLWKKTAAASPEEEKGAPLKFSEILRLRGVVPVLLAFLSYCAFESTCGLWSSSWLAGERGMDGGTAAAAASLFYLGITSGRFLSGFIADRAGDVRMIRGGLLLALSGVLLTALSAGSSLMAQAGLLAAGLGAAPVYPSVIHSTPRNFGRENSQAVIGMQMAVAYVGSTLMPPLFGLIAERITLGVYPVYLAFFLVAALVMSERVNKSSRP